MKLYYSTLSPYVRKIRVLAIELGLDQRIELVATPVSPVELNPIVAARNPLAKVPSLELDDGTALYDSRVISEYLLSLAPSAAILPAGSERWPILRRQALADGILDAALLARYEEALRPAALRWADWQAGQEGKILRGVAALEVEIEALGDTPRLDAVAVACMLGYLDLRFGRLDWRALAPRLAAFEARFDDCDQAVGLGH
jgi:glutathione S-transferase